ncbi:hypothetical protein [Ornithinimicrobium cryptoxanthini]|uniref:hypothetical protein n=1 Tax=Ornithinimicrobium cryptoxanthini TaxID=2934161 RepID=UPI0021188D62|nr:hypothetical protein [Ornithinimicrobium cryptoxanthini]
MGRREGIVAYLRDELLDHPAPDFHVRSRLASERTVATATVHVTQTDLVPTIVRLRNDLRDHVAQGGARHTEEHWVIYHGTVTPDSDGPIEVCVPYEGAAAPAREVTLRVEPAHEEAWVPLTAAECTYPPILHAYAAVERWIREYGRLAGPPREIYPVPWDDRPDAGPVAEIARPYLPPFS